MELEFKRIALSKFENIGIITLNRPESLNVFSFETFREMDYALKLFESEDKIKVILIKANCGLSADNEKVFSTGENLKEYQTKFKLIEENPAEFEKILKQSKSVLTRIETLKKPVVAGVDGLAAGGAFEFILACDIILLSDEAKLQLNGIDLGLVPAYGGLQRLLKSVGKKRAFEIAASGRIISAQEARYEMGIVAEIFSASEFNKRIIEYCKQLSIKPSLALWLIKDTINQISFKPIYDEIEIKNFIKAAASKDAKEGVETFLSQQEAEVHN